MASEEELKYKVVVDASDVPSYLNSIQQQIDMTMAGGANMNQPAFQPAMYQAPAAIPMSQADFGNLPQNFMSEGPGGWLQRSSQVLQEGYYKAKDLAENATLTAQVEKYRLSNYFNTKYNPLGSMSPIQTIGVGIGFGYDPYESPYSIGQTQDLAKQRLMDNLTPGLSQFGIGDLAMTGLDVGGVVGGAIGLVTGGFGGAMVGSTIGSVAGATIGAGLGIVNEVAKPFAEEASFRRNITRGLKEYSKYATSGAMSFDDRAEVADYLANRDLSVELLGTGTSRKDIEEMFGQLTQTSFFQESSNKEDMIEKIKGFTKEFTHVMHVFKVAKEEVGKVVDTMNEAGLLGDGSTFGNNIGEAARFVGGLGYAARLNPEQSMQLFQTGAEMMRGTGINMASGGEMVLEQRALIENAVKDKLIDYETIRQLGGVNNAAINTSHYMTERATSPEGLIVGNAFLQGDVKGSDNLSTIYSKGMSNINSFGGFFDAMRDVRESYDTPEQQQLVTSAMLAKELMYLQKYTGNQITEHNAVDVIAARTGKDINTSKLIYNQITMEQDAAFKPITDRLISEDVASSQESNYTELSKTLDLISNTGKSLWRSTLGSLINPPSSESEINRFLESKNRMFSPEGYMDSNKRFTMDDGTVDMGRLLELNSKQYDKWKNVRVSEGSSETLKEFLDDRGMALGDKTSLFQHDSPSEKLMYEMVTDTHWSNREIEDFSRKVMGFSKDSESNKYTKKELKDAGITQEILDSEIYKETVKLSKDSSALRDAIISAPTDRPNTRDEMIKHEAIRKTLDNKEFLVESKGIYSYGKHDYINDVIKRFEETRPGFFRANDTDKEKYAKVQKEIYSQDSKHNRDGFLEYIIHNNSTEDHLVLDEKGAKGLLEGFNNVYEKMSEEDREGEKGERNRELYNVLDQAMRDKPAREMASRAAEGMRMLGLDPLTTKINSSTEALYAQLGSGAFTNGGKDDPRYQKIEKEIKATSELLASTQQFRDSINKGEGATQETMVTAQADTNEILMKQSRILERGNQLQVMALVRSGLPFDHIDYGITQEKYKFGL